MISAVPVRLQPLLVVAIVHVFIGFGSLMESDCFLSIMQLHLGMIVVHGLFTSVLASPPQNLSDIGGQLGGSSPKVVGGECVSTACDEYPWFVRITVRLQTAKYHCGGSLIDAYTVLTAAHCFEQPLKEQGQFVSVLYFNNNQTLHGLVDVRVGTCNWRQTGKALYPALIHIHSEYRGSFDLGYAYDAAVIKLAEPGATNVSRFVSLFNSSISHHVEGVRGGNKAQILGWGRTEYGLPSECLRMATVKLKTDKKCRRTLSGKWIKDYNREIMMCANRNKADACHGDSGGPLLLAVQSEQVITGIVSFGHPRECAVKEYPTVYTRVSAIVPWIESSKYFTYEI